MKKLFTLILSLLCLQLANANGVQIGELYYVLNEQYLTAEVTYDASYLNFSNKDLVIPDKVQNGNKTYKVTYIGDYSFYKCNGLNSVSIPNSVTTIGVEAFNGCNGLTSVTIPNSVTTIGNVAFFGCNGLTSVTIPNSVTSIGVATFMDCNGLTSVTLEEGLTKIGHSAFEHCYSLQEITLPESLTEIGDGCFDYSGLKSIHIPGGIKSLINNFNYCSNLTSVTFSEGIEDIGKFNYTYLGMPEDGCFMYCTNLTSVSFPEGLKTIYGFCANNGSIGCPNLTSVTLPQSLTSISGFDGLTSIILPKNVNYVQYLGSKNLVEVTVENPVPFSDFSLKFIPIKPQYATVTIKVPTDSWEQYITTSPWYEYFKIVPVDGFKGSLSADNFEINSNEEVTIPVSVSFTPGCAYSGVQFDVQLPNSLQFVSASLNEELLTAAFKLDTEAQGNNTTRLLVTPTSNLDGVTTTENIILLTVKADSNAEAAIETIKFTKGYVSNIYGQDINLTDSETQVTILSSIRSITIDPQVYNVNAGESVEITAKVEPANATNTDLLWSFPQEPSLPFVGSGLTVKVLTTTLSSPSSYTITATSPNDANIKATATINVIGTAYITAPKNKIKVKEKLQLSATLNGNGSSLQFDWTSSNPEYATVDPTTGLVTGIAPGTTTITATLNSNYYKATPATFEVTVLPILLGDANDNGYVTVADVVTIADHIAEKLTYGWCEPNADVNGDNQITVADVNGTINIIMGKEPNAVRSAARKLNSVNDYLVVDNFTTAHGQSLNIGVHLDNSIEYSALQAAFMIPEGMTVESVNTGSRASNHNLIYNITDDNKLIVVLYSMTNDSFTDNGGELLNIQVKADALCEDLRVENIHASDSNSFDYELTSTGGKNQGVSTGLESLDSCESYVSVYAEGIKVLNAEGADICIYSIAGEILASEKAQSNVVMFPLAKGIYIVTVNGKSFKIKI